MNTSYQGSVTRFVTKEAASFTELVEHQEAVILDLESLHYFSLNAAATLLWKHLRSGAATSVEELGDVLANAFGLDRRSAEADAAQFVAELERQQLVSGATGAVRGPGPAPATPPAGVLKGYESPALKTFNSLMEMKLASATSTISGGS
jgi:hypothetical protein